MEITEVQTILQSVGLYAGPVNGVEDQATMRAIIAFQLSKGIFGSGLVDAATIAGLLAAQASAASRRVFA